MGKIMYERKFSNIIVSCAEEDRFLFELFKNKNDKFLYSIDSECKGLGFGNNGNRRNSWYSFIAYVILVNYFNVQIVCIR